MKLISWERSIQTVSLNQLNYNILCGDTSNIKGTAIVALLIFTDDPFCDPPPDLFKKSCQQTEPSVCRYLLIGLFKDFILPIRLLLLYFYRGDVYMKISVAINWMIID